MKIKQTNDSEVRETIKKTEKPAVPYSVEAVEEKTPSKIKPGELIGALIILALLGISLVQSVELINLRNQLKNGQFGANANASAPATGGAQGLPAQQGGC